MKVIDVLELSQKPIELLQKSCIRIDDVRFLPLYHDYVDMHGLKKAYVVNALAAKYGISERKVYYLIRKFSQDCKIGAAE